MGRHGKLTALAMLAAGAAGLLFSFSTYAQVLTPAPSTQAEIGVKSAEIQELERQIAQFGNEIVERQGRQRTLKNDLAILDAKIKKAQLEIQRLALLVKNLSGDIAVREDGIGKAEADILRRQGIIAQGLRTLAFRERIPVLLLFAVGGQFSDLFGGLAALESLEERLHAELVRVRAAKATLEGERDALAERKNDAEQLKTLQESTKQSLQNTTAEKQRLLTVTKGEEKKFQEQVKLSKAKVEQLKNEIYYLQRIGVTAEQAAQLGQLVASRIGIRASFLIAILEIESRMGANVGKGTWTVDMPPRDHEAFKQICAELGLDPDKVPVSKKPSYGWGGAMGPAQFIPTTWLGYKERIAFFSGHNPPNPWNIEDAFFAAAIKLAKDGASSKTTEGELRAAKAYIGGSPYCAKDICNYYANLAIEKAAAIEKTLQ